MRYFLGALIPLHFLSTNLFGASPMLDQQPPYERPPALQTDLLDFDFEDNMNQDRPPPPPPPRHGRQFNGFPQHVYAINSPINMLTPVVRRPVFVDRLRHAPILLIPPPVMVAGNTQVETPNHGNAHFRSPRRSAAGFVPARPQLSILTTPLSRMAVYHNPWASSDSSSLSVVHGVHPAD